MNYYMEGRKERREGGEGQGGKGEEWGRREGGREEERESKNLSADRQQLCLDNHKTYTAGLVAVRTPRQVLIQGSYVLSSVQGSMGSRPGKFSTGQFLNCRMPELSE